METPCPEDRPWFPHPGPPLEGRWITAFEGLSDTGKTKRLVVVAKKDGTRLGEIRWAGAWRKYAFFPEPSTYYENDCLRDIAGFIEKLMAERRRA